MRPRSGETVAALMPEHPARAILVRLRGEGERALGAARLLAMLDAVRAAPADLLRADRDHGDATRRWPICPR